MKYTHKYYSSLLAISVTMSLSGCISLLPSSGPAPTLIQPNVTVNPSQIKSSKIIHIEEPTAAVIYDGTKIAIKKTGETGLESYTYLEGNEWSERMPKMLQRLIVSHFKTADWPGVLGDTKILHPDYKMMIDVRKFQINLGQGIEVLINATLVDTRKFDVITTQTLTYTLPSENSVSSYKKAFDLALEQMLLDCEKLLKQVM